MRQTKLRPSGARNNPHARLRFAAPLALALGLAAGLAATESSAAPRKLDKESRRQLALLSTKHLALVNAEMQNSATNARMLSEVSRDPKTYDPASAQLFASNIRTSLGQAQAQLQRMDALVVEDDARKDLDALQARLSAADRLLEAIDAKSPATVHKDANRLYQQLNSGLDPLADLADELDVKIDLE